MQSGLRFSEKSCGSFALELWIVRLDAEEEPINRGAPKLWDVEYRMMKFRQTIQYHHADESGECCDQDGYFKGDRGLKLGQLL